MPNLLNIPAFDTAALAKTSIMEETDVGGTAVKVQSLEGFSANDLVVVGVQNTATCESHKISSVSPSTLTITLATPLRYTHPVTSDRYWDRIQRTLFDSIKIYRGSNPDTSTHSLLATVAMSLVTNTTSYLDATGDSTSVYSFEYSSSVSASVSTRTLILSGGIMGMPLDITPDYLRSNILYGLDLTDDNGNPLPDSIYWHGILAAYAWLEQVLDIDIIERTYTHRMDFDRSSYENFGFMTLPKYPVQSISSVTGKYFNSSIIFPMDWVNLKPRMGIFNLVPTGNSFSSMLLPASGSMMPQMMNGLMTVPNFWEVTYKTGFAPGTIPRNILDVVAKRACFAPLNILGDLVGGIAIASKSLSVDGLSQSINTTNSAENAGYSGRLRQYEREFKQDLPMMTTYWHRVSLGIV